MTKEYQKKATYLLLPEESSKYYFQFIGRTIPEPALKKMKDIKPGTE